MKILYTITKSEIGGAQVHVMQLAKHMKDTGHAVAVMSAPGGWLENEATKLGIRFYANPFFANSFNPLRILKSFSLIKKTVSEFAPDIVHAHSSFAGILTRAAVRNKIPTIFTAHSWAFTDGASIFRKIIAPISERFVSKYTSKIICVSEYDRKLAVRYRIAPAEKLVVIHNGAARNPFTDVVKENVLVTNGRLAYPKEYLLLLESYKLSGTDMKLAIISDGPDRPIIESKISELGLTAKVSLLGNLSSREMVQEILAQSKLFVLISKHEGMPLSILEAMSAELPVIASNVGGIPEEIDSDCGVLVRNTKEEIASAIRLLSDEDTQKAMGLAARKKFEEHFTLEQFLTKTKKVYEEVLKSLIQKP